MIIAEMNGYSVRLPESGGKAGTGHTVTSSVQVWRGNVIVKQFRFRMRVAKSARDAAAKARNWILTQPVAPVLQ